VRRVDIGPFDEIQLADVFQVSWLVLTETYTIGNKFLDVHSQFFEHSFVFLGHYPFVWICDSTVLALLQGEGILR
jgi:hypothetical protein